MDYSELREDYAKAIWNAYNSTSESLMNINSALASQIGASLSKSDKASIQQSIKVQLQLRAMFGGQS